MSQIQKLSRKLKGTVRRIDGNQCVLCWTFGTVGSHNRLTVHHTTHLNPPSVENCVTLCATCHGKVTTNPRSPLAWLLQFIMEIRKRYLAAYMGEIR